MVAVTQQQRPSGLIRATTASAAAAAAAAAAELACARRRGRHVRAPHEAERQRDWLTELRHCAHLGREPRRGSEECTDGTQAHGAKWHGLVAGALNQGRCHRRKCLERACTRVFELLHHHRSHTIELAQPG